MEEINQKECKAKDCDWYYFCHAVANYCPLNGKMIHGTPKLTQEFKAKIIALGLLSIIEKEHK